MAKFSIEVQKTVPAFCKLEIEADSLEEAKEKALELVEEGDYLEDNMLGDYEVSWWKELE